jgi:hypothetical protein
VRLRHGHAFLHHDDFGGIAAILPSAGQFDDDHDERTILDGAATRAASVKPTQT